MRKVLCECKDEIVLYAIADSYVDSENPNQNFGNNYYLESAPYPMYVVGIFTTTIPPHGLENHCYKNRCHGSLEPRPFVSEP
jgi:hypothetical protein